MLSAVAAWSTVRSSGAIGGSARPRWALPLGGVAGSAASMVESSDRSRTRGSFPEPPPPGALGGGSSCTAVFVQLLPIVYGTPIVDRQIHEQLLTLLLK